MEDLIDIASLLPSWLSLALAPVAYLIFHHFSSQDLPPSQGMENARELISASFLRAFATAAQYIAPFVFSLGAITSFVKRRKRQRVFFQTAARSEANTLLQLSWREFELLISEYFLKQGYKVTETAEAGPDGGIDLALRKDGELFLVQCKHWRAQKVGVEVVRELYGLMAAHGAIGGFVVTSGSFSSQAQEFSEGRNIELLDGGHLRFLLPAMAGKSAEQALVIPTCPTCGAVMAKRTARRGRDAGQQFWGCSTYPRCRGTRSLADAAG